MMLSNLFNNFLDSDLARIIINIFGVIRDVFIVFDIILVIALVAVFAASLRFRPSFVPNPRKFKKTLTLKSAIIKEGWDRIMKKSESAPPQSLTLAIIEADSFVDDVLKTDLALPGEHMADRLTRLNSEDYKTLSRLWQAHKARNELVHSPGYSLPLADARRLLNVYEDFLKELGIL